MILAVLLFTENDQIKLGNWNPELIKSLTSNFNIVDKIIYPKYNYEKQKYLNCNSLSFTLKDLVVNIEPNPLAS